MRIHERIYIVGSGTDGIGISNEKDCTVYLVDGGGEFALIDAGVGIQPERILSNIEKDGISPRMIASVFLTHGHGDHSGGAAALSRECGATVYALKETARYVETGDLEALSMREAIRAGIYGADYEYEPCPVQPLSDDEVLRVGDLRLRVHRTEGHCSGHGCYEMRFGGRTILFSGDTIFNYGRISLQAIWDCDLRSYIETCRKISRICPDILLPSHGAFLMDRGYTYIEKAMESVRALGIPKNLTGS